MEWNGTRTNGTTIHIHQYPNIASTHSFLRSQHAAQSPRSSSRRRWCERALGAAARRSSRLPSPLLVEAPVLVQAHKLRRGSHRLRGAGSSRSFCMPFGGASSAGTVSLRSSNYLGVVERCAWTVGRSIGYLDKSVVLQDDAQQYENDCE